MQGTIRNILALAMIFATATAGAETIGSGAVTLRPDPATGAVHLTEVGEGESLGRVLEIERGKSLLIETGYRVKRVSVGDPELLDVAVLSPREVQLVARSAGATNVLIWDTRGRPQASIEVAIGTEQTYLQRELRRVLGNDTITVDGAGNALILGGSVSDTLSAEQAMSLANAFVAGQKTTEVVNLLQVGGNQQVMLKVVVAEMSRTTQREFGTNFNALIDAGSGTIMLDGLLGGLTSLGSDGGGTAFTQLSPAINLASTFFGFGALEQLGVFLDILDERGLTKVLAEPTLMARSGETARFLVGGEIPIPVQATDERVTVEFKEFGIGLDFTPTVLTDGRIHLDVTPEVSAPDFTLGIETDGFVIPAFNRRTASTSVELGHGQTLMIAGLLSEDLRDQVSEYPILGRIPILGALFRSSRYEKNETELVILVTPENVKPLGADPVRLPTDSFTDPSALEFYLYGWLEGRPPLEEEPSGLIGEAGYRISAGGEGEFHE